MGDASDIEDLIRAHHTTAHAAKLVGLGKVLIACAVSCALSVAGAVWFPYRAGPPLKVAAWAAHTRRWLTTLATTDPGSGIDVLTGYEITPDHSPPCVAPSGAPAMMPPE